MEMINSARVAPDVDHSSGDNPIANCTDAAVVEGKPLPAPVRLTQDAQFLVQPNVLILHSESSVLLEIDPAAFFGWPTAGSEIHLPALD
jgi:hypothetical protein